MQLKLPPASVCQKNEKGSCQNYEKGGSVGTFVSLGREGSCGRLAKLQKRNGPIYDKNVLNSVQ